MYYGGYGEVIPPDLEARPHGVGRRYARWKLPNAWWAWYGWWWPRWAPKKQTLLKKRYKKEREKKGTSMLFPALNLLCYQIKFKTKLLQNNRTKKKYQIPTIVRTKMIVLSFFFDTNTYFFVYLTDLPNMLVYYDTFLSIHNTFFAELLETTHNKKIRLKNIRYLMHHI